ncbi:MAG: sigma-54-dependent Fis family transcriptional regulator [Acidobacteria bacterium]|nr:sigma-54-dependent Fis family transcriptional regulator [Acidobacteriota bacterium]
MKTPPMTVLVVDDDDAIRMVLEMRLRDMGFEATLAGSADEAESLARSAHPDLVLSDVVMPGRNGLELLQSLKGEDPARPVILMTAQGTIDMAVEAMKHGAQDFLTKPLDYSKLQAILEAARQDIALRRQSETLTAKLQKESGFGPFIGLSKSIKEVYELLETVAASDASAIITGESGTGKELAARAIHEHSARAKGPFVAINAAAIPETLIESEIFGYEKGAFTGAVGIRPGCFELAHEGTLFFDELAEMPISLQPKLLRVLEDGRVRRLGSRQELAFDVRVIAATNRDLKEAVQKNLLREDLFYRLNVFTIAMPPLREHKEDIATLVQHFLREFNAKHNTNVVAVRPEALEILANYPWPGNVRELRNIIERAVIVAKGEWVELLHLPPYLRHPEVTHDGKIPLPVGATAAEMEKELILRTLEQTGNNKAEAARRLGLDVKTIRNKLKSYGMQ